MLSSSGPEAPLTSIMTAVYQPQQLVLVWKDRCHTGSSLDLLVQPFQAFRCSHTLLVAAGQRHVDEATSTPVNSITSQRIV